MIAQTTQTTQTTHRMRATRRTAAIALTGSVALAGLVGATTRAHAAAVPQPGVWHWTGARASNAAPSAAGAASAAGMTGGGKGGAQPDAIICSSDPTVHLSGGLTFRATATVAVPTGARVVAWAYTLHVPRGERALRVTTDTDSAAERVRVVADGAPGSYGAAATATVRVGVDGATRTERARVMYALVG